MEPVAEFMLVIIGATPEGRKELGQALPARESVADRLGELGLLPDQAKFLAQPGFEPGDHRLALFLPHGPSLACRPAADVVLDPVELGDAGERLAGDRRRPACGES